MPTSRMRSVGAMPRSPMKPFFTSDTHFGDHRVLNIRPRPFRSVSEMNEELVERWNLRVGKRDTLWHLGDFASNTKTAQSIFSRLNGRKHLVAGNIDRDGVRSLAWSSVQDYAELHLAGRVAGAVPLSISDVERDTSPSDQPART